MTLVESRRREGDDEPTVDQDSPDEDSHQPLTKKEREERERQRRRNQKKRKSKKNKGKAKPDEAPVVQDVEDPANTAAAAAKEGDGGVKEAAAAEKPGNEEEESDVEVEYVGEKPELNLTDPNYFYFQKIFDAFKIAENEAKAKEAGGGKSAEAEKAEKKEGGAEGESKLSKQAMLDRILAQEEEERKEREEKEAAEKDSDPLKLSRRKQRLAGRPSIAQLKASCSRPDVVEWHDVTSKEPQLLVHLKSIRNTIPVPRHWCFKRKYLAGKRGFERPPFELPEFIRKTGICEMRQAVQEKEEEKSLKTKMRDRARPKIGKIDIDYQKLHDAFFRWQTKPPMTMIGDLYFEGKEHETRLREKKPGELSDDLRIALGMPIGPNATRFPPPWLIAMQRYGPPPSYPNLKIPGLNAAIPEGCAFGYHAGGWGKPPVDENGKPLYGDVFGLHLPPINPVEQEEMNQKPWGELDSSEEEESEEEEEEEEAEDKDGQPDESGLVTPAEGLVTPSGISSGIPTGVHTPDSIQLRKKKLMEEGGDTPASSLYQVLPEKRVERVGGQMMASTHVYDLAAAKKAGGTAGAAEPAGTVEMALAPEELELSEKGLEAKYQAVLAAQRAAKDGDQDFSDMVAEHAARQSRKRKAQEDKKQNAQPDKDKKYKDFKF